MKKLLILGASGSIGIQTLDVCAKHPDELEIKGISVGRNINYLKDFLAKHKVEYAYSIERCPELELFYSNVRFYYGEDGLEKIVQEESYDTLVNALVGYVGLKPTLKAIEAHKDIALANKETLVIAGDIVRRAVRKNNVSLYPIDSEHSAIYQCIKGVNHADLKRLIITGSGGSFRKLNRSDLQNVTVEQALNHPNWKMGAKITIDSATMMNKGFEIIEAHYLFGIPYDNIDVVLHDESIVHSLVEFNDGSVLAQMSYPDMHIPIQYALLGPRHLESPYDKKLDLGKIGSLNFKTMDYERYPLVKIVKTLAKFGGNVGAIINGANDTCVSLFLNHKISFLDIERGVEEALRNATFKKNVTIDEIIYWYDWAQDFVGKLFNR